MPRPRTVILWIIALLVVFTVAGFFGVPPLLKHLVIKNLSAALNREVTIRQIKVNPYALTMAVRGFVVKDLNKSDDFFSFDELNANIESLSLFKRAIILSEVQLKEPHAQIVRHEDGTYNFSDLLEKAKSGEQKTEKPSKPVQFSVNNISISGGSVDFLDTPSNVFHEVQGLTLAVPFISNMPYCVETHVEPRFSATINGDLYTVAGKTKPFADSLETDIDIDIKDFDFARYMVYAPGKMNFKVLSGAMDLTGQVSYIQYKDRGPSLTARGNIAVRNVNIEGDNKKSLFKMPSAEIGFTSFEPYANSIHLGKAVFQAPEVMIRRSKDGAINLLSLFPEEEGTHRKTKIKGSTPKDEASQPLTLVADIFQVNEGKVFFEDLQPTEAVDVQVHKLAIKCEHVSLQKESKINVELSLGLGKKGTLSTKGTVGVDPLSANLAVDMKGIGLAAFQPYFADKVNIYISDGVLAASGNLAAESSNQKGFTATYEGRILMTNFSSHDKNTDENFLTWKALSMNPVKIGYNPIYARVGGVSLTDFYSALFINPDGTLSVSRIVAEEARQEAREVAASQKPGAKTITETANVKATGEAPPLDIEIDKITLQGGTIAFTDRYIKPSYSAKLTEMGGRISGLSPKKDRRAEVELRGKLDHYVPLEITGKINPWKENLYVDLVAKFRDLELSPFTPYSGKYAGYTIEKGKLAFDVQYLIVDKKLDAKNVIFFDQLTLGDKVESPSATKLPVRLAIALLKDRSGQIKLDLPVTGNIDDPKFSVWGIIWKIVVNLLTKAATSPFALLGSLFGSGEELSYLEFDYGMANLTEVNIKKIETLVKALEDRPSLRLDIEGHADRERDTEGLKGYLVNRKVKAQKLKELTKKKAGTVPVDDVQIESAEYPKYLKMAYDAEKFPKPKNIIGLAKGLPVPEMEKLMLTNTPVKDEDLRNLASRRAANAKDEILRSGKVTPDRVFVVEPKSLTPEKKEKLKDSRVDFRLK